MSQPLRYFSMFSGVGGFELGIEQAYSRMVGDGQANHSLSRRQETLNSTGVGNQQAERPSDEPNQPEATCVGYSEIDKYAIKVYERHFEHDNYGDATTINPTQLPDFDLLVGGFPCQAFSIAGKRAGFNDTRGTLFFDIARILAEKRPRHLVLENVKGLLSHDSGKTFQTILGVLSDLGYRVEWQVLNSKDFGVPQNRERIYFVGHLGDECGRQVFPIRQNGESSTEQHNERLQESEIAQTVTATYWKGGKGSQIRTDEPSLRQRGDKPDSNNSIRRASLTDDSRIRRLTPKECERLQGFPDDWTEEGLTELGNPTGISDTQRYKMCGNAVTVNVVQAVMEGLYGS